MAPSVYAAAMTVLSIHVGTPRSRTRFGRTFRTGGIKDSVHSVELTREGLVDDAVANLKYHGGPDRTVCVYPSEHYAWLRAEHGHALDYGAFSENLTVDGADEGSLLIGDIVAIGTARVQITLPRDPCRTIDQITGIGGLHLLLQAAGRCGFHMRTIEPGTMRVGDAFRVVERSPAGISVAAVLDLYHGRSADRALYARLCAMPDFAEEGRREIARRLG
jgi:MOSC domain-containing protein YiiM